MLSFAAIQHMPPWLALTQIAISEAFAALGYMCQNWSGRPHMKAGLVQGRGHDTHLQASHKAL